MINSKRLLTRAVLFVLVAAMLVSMLSAGVLAAEGKADAKTNQNNALILPDGYYRIRNLKVNQYLDNYDLSYDKQGSAYLDAATAQNGQDFYVSRNEDGSYTLVPQNDNGKYALSYAAGTYITKRANPGKTEFFDIFPLSSGVYTIAPAYADDASLVLAASNQKTNHGFTRLNLAPYTAAKAQQWVFEPVPVTGISLAYTEVRERLYSVGTYYAALTPYPTSAESMTWTSDNEDVLMIDNDGSWCAIGVGTANVTVTCGGKKATCRVEVVDSPSYAYYSQHDIDGSYWNGSALSGIYFSYGVTKRYAVDRYNHNLDWMDEGCALTASAILLRNLGARLTEGYDFRSGQNGNLPADPYTVSLANAGSYGAKTAKATLYGNPILLNHNRISTRFNVDGKAIVATQTYAPSVKQIKEALDKHPEGVVVGMQHYAYGSHYLLFTKCVNPESTNPYGYKFIVCDPAAYTASQGDNVPFEKCYSYLSLGYRYSCATCMIVWDVVEPQA